MQLLNKLCNKRIFISLLLSISSIYWLLYFFDAKTSLDERLYSENKFDSVRLNKYHSYDGVKGSWNIQHQYSPYLAQATKVISKDHGTKFFIDDDFNALKSNINVDQFKKTKLDSNINNDFILGLQHSFKLKSPSNIDDNWEAVVGRFATLSGRSGSSYIGYITKVTNEFLEVRAPLPMGETIDSVHLPPVKKGSQSFEVLLDSERMGLVRGGVVNQFVNDSEKYLYIRTFSEYDSQKLMQGNRSIEINGKTFFIKDLISLGMRDFLILINGEKTFQPYIDSRKNIITIKITNELSERGLEFKIPDLTDENYIFGLSRKYKIKLSNTEGFLRGGAVTFESSPRLYSVGSVENEVMTLDIFNLVKNYVSDKFGCNLPTPEKRLMAECELDILPGKSLSNIELAILRDNYNELFNAPSSPSKGISPFNTWLNGGDIDVWYEAKMPSKAKPIELTTKRNVDDNFEIWEIYPGSILNLYYRKTNPAPVEMLIHVLGKDARDSYYDSFIQTKPEYVSFAKPERFTPWLLNWHWTFFREMINNYDAVVDLDEFSLWKRNNSANNRSIVNAQLSSKKLPFLVTLGDNNDDYYKLYTVTLNYKIENPLINIPLLGKSARYFITSNASVTTLPVSIPWSENKWTFPVVVKGRESVTFDLLEMSDFLDSSHINVESIVVNEENVPQSNIIKMFLDYDSMR
ncbi:hypothetical protein ACET9I_21810 [Aeromonas veronii]